MRGGASAIILEREIGEREREMQMNMNHHYIIIAKKSMKTKRYKRRNLESSRLIFIQYANYVTS